MRPSHRLSFANFFRGLSYPIIHPVDGLKCKVFPVSTGSAAEFYIEPMLSCVGDTDVMYHYSSELAIPEWYPPPSQLPAEFESRVKFYEIKDSHLPGYVYLNPIYILARNTHDSTHIVAEYVSSRNTTLNHELYVSSDIKDEVKIQGPAHKIATSLPLLFGCENFGVMTDAVPCVHCFVWPLQASEWPKRHRNSGWPDSATVDQVVGQGCDVVGVAHRQCKQDEWMRKHQWRLSFSRAEVVLLNSWMPVQQIVYHMLRIFMKTKRLTDSDAVESEADTLNNYHIKTLMLWACELKPRKWWSYGSTFVTKCVQLLQFLVEWLTKKRGQHYFINTVRFLDYFDKFSIKTVFEVVRSTSEDILAEWFIDNYIRKFAELCPDNTSLMCSNLIASKISEEAVGMILRWKDHISNETVFKQTLSLIICCISPLIYCFQIFPIDMVTIVKNRLFTPMALSYPQIDAPAFMYSGASFLIKFMNLFEFPPFDCLAHMASDVDERCRLQFFNIDLDLESSESHNDLSHFQKAAILMEIVANKHLNTRGLLHIELSKAYLQRTLRCNGDDHCVTNVYLAVLHYITGQYQRAIDHCTLVTRSQDHSQCSLNVVQGNLLPKIDRY